SSARTSSEAGTSRPSALAVLRFRIVSYLVGACTGRLSGLEDAVDIECRVPKQVDLIGPVGHETAGCDPESGRVNRRQPVPGSEGNDKIAMQDGCGLPAVRSGRRQAHARMTGAWP